MKKIAIISILILIAISLCACDVKVESTEQEQVNTLEQEILTECLNQMSVASGELHFVNKEQVAWLDWEVYNYILIANEKAYTVSVQRNDTEVHLVDVLDEIL